MCMPHRVAVVAAAVIALAGGARGAEKARWAVVERSYPPITIDAAERHGPPDEPPAAPDSPPVKVTNVVLSNEHLSIEVAVEAAGRIMHATCARDGVEVFHVLEKLAGGRTWDGGGWRSSFPFQEHGMRYTDQPAGWRVAEGDDGSVTLAMDMRFGRFQAPEELGRYGRFTHLRLGRSITLRPGQACVEITSTVENPLPYRYGYRLWSTAQFPHEPDAEFLLAVTRVSDHGLRGLTDWRWGEGRALHRNWDTYMSVFSVNVTQPFAGVYYPARDLNRLRIADPARLPGGKLYAWSHPSFFYELWTGSEHLFEQEGRFVEPFGRQSYTERYYVARGIGRVDYANEHFAVSSQRDGNRIQVRLLPAHDVGEATAEGSVAGGAEMALSAPDGRQLTALRRPLRALAPWTLECRGDASDMPVRVRVTTGGAAGREPEVLLDVRLPLVLPPADPTLEADLRQKIRPERTDLRRLAESYEKRAWLGSRSPNLPSAALRAALDWAQARPQEAAAHLQVGRVLYMLGRLDKAVEALRLALARDAANAQAHHLLGLALLEQRQPQAAREQFLAACSDRSAAPEAHYMAAMTFLASGEQASAVEHLRQLVRAQPGAGRPRVVLAALLARQGATEEARRIALQLEREDPSSPEAALAVALAEGRGAGRSPTLDKLLSRNPEGSEAVAQLMAEIAQGRWVHPARPDTTQVEPIMPAPRPSTRPSTRPASRPAARPGARPRVLFLVGQGAEPDEFGMPFEALYAMGYAIDVASPALEVQKLMSGRGNFKDPMPHLTLEQVDVDHYLGLVLPGGNSPGHLEVFPRSAEICRAFMRAGKPVSAICHGPRLLMRAGVLRDRVATCLFTVPNELADQWVAGDYGVYLDQPVVIDRALTTSRYPYDLLPFTRATIHQLAKAGGIPPVGPARVLLIAPGAGRNDLWVLREVPAMCGMEVTSPAADQMPAAVAAADQGFDLLLIANTSGQKREAFAPHARLVEAFAAAHKPVVLVGDTGLNDAEPIAYDRPRALAALVAAARRTPRGQAPAEVVPTVVPPLAAFATPTRKDRYQAAVALRQGFDDAVVAATIAWLQGRRKDVLVLGVEEKPMRGVNGLTLTPMGRYTDQPALAPDAVIIVPGSFWPEKKESRQATQPAWIEQQEAQDDARMKWLLAARQRGATLVVFGMDSMRMAAHPQFKGKKFAGTDQAFWAFSKAGAAYADAKALVSDTRLITAKGAYTVDAALALLGGE